MLSHLHSQLELGAEVEAWGQKYAEMSLVGGGGGGGEWIDLHPRTKQQIESSKCQFR